MNGAGARTAGGTIDGWLAQHADAPAAGGYAATCAAICDSDLRDRVASIAAPTLCVVGNQDKSTPPDLVRGTAELIPNSRFEIVERASPIPCIEQPCVLSNHIRSHLAQAGWSCSEVVVAPHTAGCRAQVSVLTFEGLDRAAIFKVLESTVYQRHRWR